MPYFEKIPGERIYLSPMDPGDLEIYTKWLNDVEVTRWLGQYSAVYSLPAERAWLENATKDVNNYLFAIVLRDGDRLIGNIGLVDLNQIHRRATLGIFIGQAEDRSKGYGAEAIRLLLGYGFNWLGYGFNWLGYGFNWLGLRNIDLHVDSENARAIACYTKAGFKEYGRRHGVKFRDGAWHDDVLMEALAR